MNTAPDLQDIQQALGASFGHWSGVEFELAIIFKQAIMPKNPKGAIAAYYSLKSFDARLTITNAAVRSLVESKGIPESLSADWNAIHNKCSEKAKRRNELAHSCVMEVTEKDGSFHRYLEVYPRMYHHDEEENYLTLAQIWERSASFARLAGRLSDFEKALAAHLGTRSESRLLDDGLPQVPPKKGDRSPKANPQKSGSSPE